MFAQFFKDQEFDIIVNPNHDGRPQHDAVRISLQYMIVFASFSSSNFISLLNGYIALFLQ